MSHYYLAQYLTKAKETLFDVFMLIVVSMDEDQVGNRDYSMPRQARKSIAELPRRHRCRRRYTAQAASAEAGQGLLNAAIKPVLAHLVCGAGLHAALLPA